MRKLAASIRKEALLLTRDLGGLAVLFIMPIVLVLIVTIVQNQSYESLSSTEIPLLLVNLDNGEISTQFESSIRDASAFNLVKVGDEDEAQMRVAAGDAQLAVVLPPNLSIALQARIDDKVNTALEQLGLEVADSKQNQDASTEEIRIYFDPVSPSSFRDGVRMHVDRMVSKLETEAIYRAFKAELAEDPNEVDFEQAELIAFREISAGNEEEAIPNAVQQNVPAWTLFAIFFIIVPLSINIVKEKTQGTFVRLRAMPGSYSLVLLGKTVVYLLVSLMQFAAMLLIGIYLFPLMGLPSLELGNSPATLVLVACSSALAAIGIGLLLGTVSTTTEQSAPFGATLVVILAALGGVWVPVFAMPSFMQPIAQISPMNWGLSAFHDVFLRNGAFLAVAPEVGLLIGLFVITTALAVWKYERQYKS